MSIYEQARRRRAPACCALPTSVRNSWRRFAWPCHPAGFAGVLACMAGPGFDVTNECGCADMELDGDVDLADFAEFQVRFSNP